MFFGKKKKNKNNIIEEINIETNNCFLDNDFDFDFEEVKVYLKKIFSEITKELKAKKFVFNKIEVSLTLVNSNQIQKLNKEQRNKDSSTDVLSFPSGMLDEPFDHEELDIGDIFINVDIIESQAKSIESYSNIEFLFLFMHACLHLIGYDHIDENEAEQMYKRQREIFDITGIRKARNE